MKITDFEKQIVFEAAVYLKSNKVIRRQMVEACGAPDPDMYPEEHTGEAGRMMDYGHKKSDSHEGRMTSTRNWC